MTEKAAALLGYVSANGNVQLSLRVASKALALVNIIYSDLHAICAEGTFMPITNLEQSLNLPENVLHDVFPYGLAMMMAQGESDGDQQDLYAYLYNKKRAGLSRFESVKDVLPKGVDQ